MTFLSTPGRRPLRAAAVLLVVCGSFLATAAQTGGPEEGIRVGPWTLAPYLVASYESNDNVFLRESAVAFSSNVERVNAGVAAVLPIRNSSFRLDYETGRTDYGGASGTDRQRSDDLGLDLTLRFGTGDKLSIRDQYSRGISDVEVFDDGGAGELTIGSEQFDLNRIELDLSRQIPRLRGYSVRLSREELNFEPSETGEPIAFFDFEAFDGRLEYREPLTPRLWLAASYRARRADHFNPDDPSPDGEPFREESRDSLTVGLRGLDVNNQPFSLQVGAESFEYLRTDETEYSGLAVLGSWRTLLGEQATIEVGGGRFAVPSFFSTYYVVDELRIRYSRRLRRSWDFGVIARFSRNRYGDSELFTDGNREDTLKRADLFAEVRPHPRVGIRLSVREQKRDSNYERYDYKNTVVSTRIILGWPN